MGKEISARKLKKARGVIHHAIYDARVIKMEGLTKNCLEWSAQMQRRSATTGFIIDASLVLQDMAGCCLNLSEARPA